MRFSTERKEPLKEREAKNVRLLRQGFQREKKIRR